MTCTRMREQIVRYADDDLDAAVAREVEHHLVTCPGCAAFLAEERTLGRLIREARGPEPPEPLLDRCRRDLAEALRRESRGAGSRPGAGYRWRRPEAFLAAARARLSAARLRLSPVGTRFRLSPVAAALLLVAGFAGGRFLPSLRGAGSEMPPAEEFAGEGAGMPDSIAVRDLVAGPSAGTVRVSFDTLRRGALEGPPDDPRIRSLLATAARDNLNDGLRLEAIEALGAQMDAAEARAALLHAAVEDRNPGARLRAIEALETRAAEDSEARQAIMEALLRDDNPGVRVAALDALAAARHPDTIPALRRLGREDRNDYVRIRAAALAGESWGGGER